MSPTAGQSGASAHSTASRIWGLTERLSQEDIHKIAQSYEAGELRRDIAARYKISISRVSRLLRKWRTERDDVA